MSQDSEVPEQAGQLREEAAEWFARMRGPDADGHRAAFERWLARGALHRAAYNRIAEVFSAGKLLKDERGRRTTRGSLALIAVALLIGAALVMATLTFNDRRHAFATFRPGGTEVVSVGGQLRRVQLADGSIVTLDSDSLLAVRFTGASRRLRLKRGRARFDVRHDSRTFSVSAGTTEITAHGTLFDVAVLGNRSVSIDLLRGSVEVAANVPTRAEIRPVRLQPGQRIVTRSDGTLTPPTARGDQANWASRLIAFDRTPLSEVIAQANRYSVDQITIADPAIGTLVVSGTFRINDPERLTERLAALFDLQIDRRVPGMIVLRRIPKIVS